MFHQIKQAYYTKGNQKVPGIVVLHCGKICGNAYIITLKTVPMSTHNSSIDSAIIVSKVGRFILENFGVWPSHSI
jgi:hypothetical protein